MSAAARCSPFVGVDLCRMRFGSQIRLEPANKAELLPRLVDTFRRRAQQHADQRDWNQAVRSIAEAMALDPKQPKDHVLRAGFHAKSQSWIAAIEDYEQAVKLDPDLSERFRRIMPACTQRGLHGARKTENGNSLEATPKDE